MARTFESQLVEHLVDNYFGGERADFAERTGYYKHQVDAWIAGVNKPQKATIRHLLSSCIAPEFQVVAEFKHVDMDQKSHIRPELRKALGVHAEKCGVYAFYDSMCTVIYIGKASSGFLEEMYQQLRANLGVPLPKRVRTSSFKRWEVVRYVSAYEVPDVDHLDYPKHVEALVLRLAKPIGNKVLGTLSKSKAPKDHGEARRT